MALKREDFAQLLAQKLAESGLSGRKFAKRCGTTHTTMQNWLGGKPPRSRNVHRVIELGVLRDDEAWPALTATLRSIDSPGWMCLRQITRPLAAATRTLVPSATPHLKVA